jgi:hypothetical protein
MATTAAHTISKEEVRDFFSGLKKARFPLRSVIPVRRWTFRKYSR